MNSSPRICAVTVTYNPGKDLQPFLESFRAQDYPNLELIIVDNDSRDGTAAILDGLADPNIHVIRNDHNAGVAAANNQGIVHSLKRGAAAVLLINNDTEFGPELVSGLWARLDFPAVAAVSPLIPYYEDPDRIWYAGGRFHRWRGILNLHDGDGAPTASVGVAPYRTEYAPTCCLLFDRRVFETVGLMDERYFVYWDDTDFVWRMKQAGLGLLIDPAQRLLHKVSRSTGGAQSPFSIRYVNRNQMYFTRKHFSIGWVAYTAFANAMTGVLKLLLGRATRAQTWLRLQALAEGMRMPIETPNKTGEMRS